ncbi:MAG: glycosyltransferase, partial [Phycisphaerae bacterium]|nr:glycosyltransferase [Phycisphaerae bacterium]
MRWPLQQTGAKVDSMSVPTVSVIIPAYNCGQMLRQAVDSVRRQTYQDLEVIIVDDGSTDDTPEVVRELAADWSKIRPILAEHKGLAAARNRAVAEMRGQWIALLDADDLWIPEKLARCMDYLADHEGVSIVYTPMQPIRMSGEPMAGHSKPCLAGQLTRKLFKSIFVHDPAAVFHKRVIEKCGGFDESLPVCVGHEFWLRATTEFEFGLINEPLAQRRWHEKSLTRS